MISIFVGGVGHGRGKVSLGGVICQKRYFPAWRKGGGGEKVPCRNRKTSEWNIGRESAGPSGTPLFGKRDQVLAYATADENTMAHPLLSQ